MGNKDVYFASIFVSCIQSVPCVSHHFKTTKLQYTVMHDNKFGNNAWSKSKIRSFSKA